jgi:hypothetical protein
LLFETKGQKKLKKERETQR